LKPGDGLVFDEGHPEQDEQGGRVFAVRPIGHGQIEIETRRGDVNAAAIAPGSIVWKTMTPRCADGLNIPSRAMNVVDRNAADRHCPRSRWSTIERASVRRRGGSDGRVGKAT